MNKKWNEKTTLEKTVTIISGIALFVWLLFEVLEKTTTMQYTRFVSYIAICVICACEAISFWNVRRSLSYVAIGGGIFLSVIMVLEILLLL